MKKIMLILLGCLLSSPCFAGSMNELDSKLYVTPGSIYVAPDAIYVNMNNNFIAVEGVYSDSSGIYIKPLEFRYMYCLKCKKWHDPAITPCD